MTTLKQHRQYAALSIKDVAAHMNVTERAVYSWEDGSRPLTAINLYKLMALYKADAKISQLPELIPMHGPSPDERGDQSK